MRVENIHFNTDFSNSVVPGDSILLFVGKDDNNNPTLNYKDSAGEFHTFSVNTPVSSDTSDTSDTSISSDSSIDPNLLPENIKYNVTIEGITGTFTGDGDATASDVLSGKKAYVKGSLVTGSIQTVQATLSANVTTVPKGYIAAAQTLTVPEAGSITTSALTVTVPVGYIASARTVTLTDANLVAGNIKSGVSIFGVTGTYTSGATATASTILSGYTAYANGELITGEYVCPETPSESSAAVEEDVILGVVDAQGKFQPFSFSGTTPTNSGTAETVSNYNTWNSTLPPPTPTPSGSVDYYKCASVNTSNQTWTGYKAIYNSSSGIWGIESSLTSGLTYGNSYVPEVDRFYNDGANVQARLRLSIDTGDLVLYVPLNSYAASAVTGQTLTTTGSVTFAEENGILCAYFNGESRINLPSTGINSGKNPLSASLLLKSISESSSWELALGAGGTADSTQFGIARDSGGNIAFGGGGLDLQTSIAANTWHHVVVTFFGNELKLYVDSSLVDTLDATNLEVGNYGIVSIGDAINIGSGYFYGYIAEVAMWNKVLTQDQVTREYDRIRV